MTLKACGNYVIVRQLIKKISQEIIIPESFERQVSDAYGEVISVGENCPFIVDIKAGDKILYRKNEGTKLDIAVGEFLALKSEWVLAKIEDFK